MDDKTEKPKAYIGEGEDVGKRIGQQKEKEFWVQVIVFISKDDNLTKAYIKYLEGRLIEESKKVGRYILENVPPSGAKLPEADQADMEVFLTKIQQLLSVLGCDILSPVIKPTKAKAANSTLVFKVKGVTAEGQRTPNGFVVFKDSTATLDLRPSAPQWVIKQRELLTQAGILMPMEDHLLFTMESEFSSPSAAAAIVCGGHVNGLTAWKNSEGKTLKAIEGAI